jgi:parvulin-like peptidyl-prolyl isomerase
VADTKKELGSEEALRRRLKVLGLPPERYTNQVMEQALAQAVVDREVRAKVEVPPGDIEEFYQSGTDVLVRSLQAELERLAKDPQASADRLAAVKKQIDAVKKSNRARLEQPERVRVSHVMLATRDRNSDQPLTDAQKKIKRTQIEKLRIAALAGEDFQKLALEFSEDRNVKETKGEYVLTRDGNFVPEFKVAAFSLAPGQISDVLTTAFGYHVLKVSEKIPAQKVALETVRKDIQDMLIEQEVQKRMPGYFRDIKQQAGVEVLDAKLAGETNKEANPLKD